MIEAIISYIQSLISQYGALGVFIAALIEQIIAPIPSQLVPLTAGFFLLPANIPFIETIFKGIIMIATPAVVGIIIGATLVYIAGFFGGKPIIEKTKKLTGINWQNIEKTEARFTKGKGDEIVLFILRLLPIVPGVAISAFCGIVRYPFKKFIIITIIGSFIRAFALSMVGWQVGELYANYAEIIAKFERYILLGVFSLLLLFIFIFFIRKKILSRQKQ